MVDVYALMQCMLAKRLTMTDLAEKLGVTRQAVSHRLKQSHLVTEKFVEDVEKVLGMDRLRFSTCLVARPDDEERQRIKEMRKVVGGRAKTGVAYQRAGSFVVTAHSGDDE